jgi:phage baseplate assembly protein V
MLRFGIITEADPAKCYARVTFTDDGIVSDWLQILVRAAIQDSDSFTFDINEQVACLMDENSEQGVILGAIFNDSTNPKSGGKGITRFQLSDNSVIEYDRNSHEYNLDIKGKINVKSDLEVNIQTLSAKITAASVAIIGNTAITGNLAVSGTLSGGGISASAGELTVKDVTADNGVKLKLHKHTGVATGSGASGIATP